MDVKVSKFGDTLKSDLFTKSTDTHQYLQYSSCHPFHTKRSIPYSQTLRLRRICSEEDDFQKRVLELKGWLNNRGYDSELVNKQVEDAMQVNRETALLEKCPNDGNDNDRDVLVLTYHPALSKKVFEIIRSNHNILALGEEHRELFSRTPMVSFRRTKSLKDILVRAMVKCQSTEPNVCTGCNKRSDCQVCNILVNSDKFSNREGTRVYNIRKGTLHCNSKNVIYLLTCKTCNKQYIGSTTRSFRERYNNYKSKFRKYFRCKTKNTIKKNKPIEQANLFEHFFEHIGENFIKDGKEDWTFWSFQIIDSSYNEVKLLERESFWQQKLLTFIPSGLNERDVPFS